MTSAIEDLTIVEETIWVPVDEQTSGDDFEYYSSDDSTSYIKVEKGVSALKSFEVGAAGKGSKLQGSLKGKVTSYDYKALYKVYNLKDSDSVDVWIINYKRDKSRAELKKASESSNKITTDVDMKFTLEGNDRGITKIWIGFSVLRLKTETTQKDYSITNASSAKGKTPDGKDYDVKFEEV